MPLFSRESLKSGRSEARTKGVKVPNRSIIMHVHYNYSTPPFPLQKPEKLVHWLGIPHLHLVYSLKVGKIHHWPTCLRQAELLH